MRISTNSTYQRLLTGIQRNFSLLANAQASLSTGKRILRPSDDPTGTSQVLGFERRLAETRRVLDTIGQGRPVLDSAAGRLEDGSAALAKARELLVGGLNGALSDADRESIAQEVKLLRKQMIELANSRYSDRYLFGGTAGNTQPWVEANVGGLQRVQYQGTDDEQAISIGGGVEVAINLSGSSIFGGGQPTGPALDGATGLQIGSTASQGEGYEYVILSHTSTDPGTLASVGVSLANGGANDTLLGDQTITIDATANTVQLGDGPAVKMPDAASADAANFAVTNGNNGTIHLDLSAYTGADFSGTVSGAGEISPIDFNETNQKLTSSTTGSVLHVDLSGIQAAGEELVTYEGTVNVFDVLQGVVDDLLSAPDISSDQLTDRLSARLSELDRNQEQLLSSLGVLGSRSARLANVEQHQQSVEVELSALRSAIEDTDITEVVLDLSKAEQTLQIVQSTGVRILGNSLINFL